MTPNEYAAVLAGMHMVGDHYELSFSDALGQASSKRGRPPIPASQKAAALKAKNAGQSPREYSKILYNTPYPSTSQLRNAWNILNRFEKNQGSS